MTATLWDDPTPAAATPTHAHTEPSCTFCATRIGPMALDAAVIAVTRDPEWHYRAAQWLASWPVGDTFTADDLTDPTIGIGMPQGSANQIGALIRTWSAQGWITYQRHTRSTRRQSHSRAVAVWAVA